MTTAPTIPVVPPSPVDKITPPPSTTQVLRALILKELRKNLFILAIIFCGEALIALTKLLAIGAWRILLCL